MKPVTTTETAFKVRSWRPFSKNSLLGFLTLELPSGLIINDCTLHQKNRSKWVGLPAQQHEQNGEKTEEFQADALEAIEAHLRGTHDGHDA